MDAHPLAECLPLLSDDELQRLAEDILAHGLHNPITVYEGKILDGRNRALACAMVGIEPEVVGWAGDFEGARTLVWSQNVLRRHLPPDQQGAIWVKLAAIAGSYQARVREDVQVAAKERQRQGGREKVVQPSAQAPDERKARAAEARAAGVSYETLRCLRALEDDQLDAVASGRAKLADIRREQRQAARAQRNAEIVTRNAALPAGQRKYTVIYVDPPWRYEHPVSDSRAIEEHYPTMPLDEICELPVEAMAEDDAILFLWCPSSLLHYGTEVERRWGFDHRSAIYWDKDAMGMGYWVRQQVEVLLISICGKPAAPEPMNRPVSIVRCKASRKHSEKPAIFREIIERMFPGVARIELFARGSLDDKMWDRWGNQNEEEKM